MKRRDRARAAGVFPFSFAGQAVGAEVYLESKTFEGGEYQGKQAFKVMKFKVTESSTDSFELPTVLSDYAPLPEAAWQRAMDAWAWGAMK